MAGYKLCRSNNRAEGQVENGVDIGESRAQGAYKIYFGGGYAFYVWKHFVFAA